MIRTYLSENQIDYFSEYLDKDMIDAIQEVLHGHDGPYCKYKHFSFSERLLYSVCDVSDVMEKTHRIIEEVFETNCYNTAEKFAELACKYRLDFMPWKPCFEKYEEIYLRICTAYFKKIGYIYHVSSECIRRNSILVYMFNKQDNRLRYMANEIHTYNAVYGCDFKNFYLAYLYKKLNVVLNKNDVQLIDNPKLLGKNLLFFMKLTDRESANTILKVIRCQPRYKKIDREDLMDLVFNDAASKQNYYEDIDLDFDGKTIVVKTTNTRVLYV
jgi:hypothetical protein